MTDYEKQTQDFLTKTGVKFKAIFKGDKCPMWDDKHIHGDRYLVTFSRIVDKEYKTIPSYIGKPNFTPKTIINKEYKSFSLSFWNSLNDSQNGKTPTPYDVIACLTKYDPGTFKNFCGDFGYDTDSRKGYATYKAVIREWQKVQTFFTESEIEQLAEIN
jgi:hypothetical protein